MVCEVKYANYFPRVDSNTYASPTQAAYLQLKHKFLSTPYFSLDKTHYGCFSTPQHPQRKLLLLPLVLLNFPFTRLLEQKIMLPAFLVMIAPYTTVCLLTVSSLQEVKPYRLHRIKPRGLCYHHLACALFGPMSGIPVTQHLSPRMLGLSQMLQRSSPGPIFFDAPALTYLSFVVIFLYCESQYLLNMMPAHKTY